MNATNEEKYRLESLIVEGQSKGSAMGIPTVGIVSYIDNMGHLLQFGIVSYIDNLGNLLQFGIVSYIDNVGYLL